MTAKLVVKNKNWTGSSASVDMPSEAVAAVAKILRDLSETQPNGRIDRLELIIEVPGVPGLTADQQIVFAVARQ